MNALKLAVWSSALFIAASLFSNTVALRLFLLVIGTGLALFAVVQGRDTVRPLPPLWLAFTAWAAWAWLSLAWSVEPERTLKELRNETVYAWLAFWMCYVAAQARQSARVMLPVLGAAAVLLCGIALYAFSQGMVRVGEKWHGGAGNLSTVVLTLLPCALMAGWYGHRTGRKQLRVWSVALTVLLLVAGYTTLNRTIWFGIALEILIISTLLVLRGRHAMAPRRTATAAVIAILALTAAAIMSSHIQTERKENEEVRAISEDTRFKLWPEVVTHIKQRPLTGFGFGRGGLRQPLQREFQDPLLWHTHNLLLDTTVQVGIPGLVLLLVLLGDTLRVGWRMTRVPDSVAASCGIAVIGVVAGILMRNMTDMLWVRHNALLYWALLGVLFAWGHTGRPGATR